jgi:hypothetical protein
MLTRFKQQAQETGAFLKKQQQTFSQQVQKGIKMATYLNSAQKKENHLEHSQEAPIGSTAVLGRRDEHSFMRNPEQVGFDQMGEWTSALVQMGFERSHICEAADMLGGQPHQMDDLLQAVVAIAASEEKDICGGASSSSMPSSSSEEKDICGGASSSSMPSSSNLAEARLASEACPADAKPEPSIDKVVPLATQQPPLPAPLSPSLDPCVFASESHVLAEDETMLLSDVTLWMQRYGRNDETMKRAPPKPDVGICENLMDIIAEPETSHADAEVLYDTAGAEPEESQRSLRSPDLAQIQVSNKDLAAAIVASAIAKAASKVPNTQTATKQPVEHPSPVRGGA